MAAETLASDRAAATFPVFQPMGPGTVACAYGTYAVAANVEDGDIFQMCRVPKNATVFWGYVASGDIDTNATETLDFDAGWAANGVDAADPDGFGNFGVVTGDAVAGIKPEVGIWMPLGGVLLSAGPKTFQAETILQIEANAVAATFAASTLTMAVLYLHSGDAT